MNTADRLIEAEASAVAAARRDADFAQRQAARAARLAPGVIVADPRDWPRGQAAGLAGHPATPPADAADADVWLDGYRDGARLRQLRDAARDLARREATMDADAMRREAT